MPAKRLLVFLTDALATFQQKGEIKPRYYNPCDTFAEVHFVSPASAADEVDAPTVQTIVGKASIFIHALGPRYYATALAPWGRVSHLLTHIQPDIIRAYDPAVRGSLAVYWGRQLHVPSVVSVHADLDEQRQHEQRPSHSVRRVFERYCLTRAEAVICVTHHVAAYARRHGAGAPAVIYNRVDTNQFVPDAGLANRAQTRSRLSVLSVGRFVPQKYQECLIRAVERLPLELRLIGEGPMRAPLQGLVDSLGLAEQVTFPGSVPHRSIAEHYRAADLFAIATHYEGFCIPVLEAMAAGLPIVASRISPIQEIVGDCAVLVENRPDAFAAAFKTLLEAPELRAELGRRARARALSLDGSLMEQREAAAYSALVAARSSERPGSPQSAV